MGSPKKPDPIKPPPPVAAQAKLVDLGSGEDGGASNFEAELKKRRKQAQTSYAGETGGYGGSTNLG